MPFAKQTGIWVPSIDPDDHNKVPQSVQHETDLWDLEAYDTGLLDSAGNPILRSPPRMGFHCPKDV